MSALLRPRSSCKAGVVTPVGRGHAGSSPRMRMDAPSVSCADIVSMGVIPIARGGAGRGTAPLRTCLRVAPRRTAVLSTHRERNPALRPYRRKGFVRIHLGLRFADSALPFVAMARDLCPPK